MEPTDYHGVLTDAAGIHAEQNEKYGEEWREWQLTSLIDLASAKCRRVMGAVGRQDWVEAKEEGLHALNSIAFACARIHEHLEERDALSVHWEYWLDNLNWPESWEQEKRQLGARLANVLDEHYEEFDSHDISDLVGQVYRWLEERDG